MIFIPLLFIAIFFYLNGKRISSVILFFFFLTDGFQIIPLELFDTKLGIDKPTDFCVLYTIILWIYGLLNYFGFIPQKDKISKTIFLFLGFIVLGIFINRYVYIVPWENIVRTVRFFFIILSYFIFIRLKKEEIEKIHRILFLIALMQSILFISQVIFGEAILTGYAGGGKMIGIGFKRFYNLPYLIYYFVFYALFKNPYTGTKKLISTSLLVIAFLLPMHRGWIIAFVLLYFLGSYLHNGFKGLIKYFFIGFLFVIPLSAQIISRFEKGGTDNDFKNVISGNYKLYLENTISFGDATFLYRMVHFYERFMFILSDNKYIIFGLGYMTEDSPITNERFNFMIGLPSEKNLSAIEQLDTPDIAWSNLFVRFGVLGTIIYLLFFFSLIVFFWKTNKKDNIVPISFLFLLFLTSITSSLFGYAWLFSIVFLDVKAIESNYQSLPSKNEIP
jgi:hypothetical protein